MRLRLVPAFVTLFMASPAHRPADEVAVLAGGCFWGIEAVFEHVRGVRHVESGYTGGSVASPSYDDVSSGSTGHAEAVRIVFDPTVVSYEQLLRVFFTVAHDPTELNRQGPDIGTQYRSAVFSTTPVQHRVAGAMIDSLNKLTAFRGKIVTQLVALKNFYVAESYHQDYLANHPNEPYIVAFDAPKLVDLAKRFPDLYTVQQNPKRYK